MCDKELHCLSECFAKQDVVFGIQNGDVDMAGGEEVEEPDLECDENPFTVDAPPPGEPGITIQLQVDSLFHCEDVLTDCDGMEIDCCRDEDGNIVYPEDEPEPVDERPMVIIDEDPENEPPDENIDIGEENPNGSGTNSVDENEPPPLEDPKPKPSDPVIVNTPIDPLFPEYRIEMDIDLASILT